MFLCTLLVYEMTSVHMYKGYRVIFPGTTAVKEEHHKGSRLSLRLDLTPGASHEVIKEVQEEEDECVNPSNNSVTDESTDKPETSLPTVHDGFLISKMVNNRLKFLNDGTHKNGTGKMYAQFKRQQDKTTLTKESKPSAANSEETATHKKDSKGQFCLPAL